MHTPEPSSGLMNSSALSGGVDFLDFFSCLTAGEEGAFLFKDSDLDEDCEDGVGKQSSSSSDTLFALLLVFLPPFFFSC